MHNAKEHKFGRIQTKKLRYLYHEPADHILGWIQWCKLNPTILSKIENTKLITVTHKAKNQVKEKLKLAFF